MIRNASATSPISSSVSTAMLVSRSPRAMASAPACRFCSGRVMRRREQVRQHDRQQQRRQRAQDQGRAGRGGARRPAARDRRRRRADRPARRSRPAADRTRPSTDGPSTSSGTTGRRCPSPAHRGSRAAASGPTSRAPVAAMNVDALGSRADVDHDLAPGAQRRLQAVDDRPVDGHRHDRRAQRAAAPDRPAAAPRARPADRARARR